MEAPAIAQFARNLAVMVRIHGPDPKGLKTRRHAFHLHQSGETTLSASGLLLPPGSLSYPPPIIDHICSIQGHSGAVVVTTASVVESFLAGEHRNNPNQEFSPKLIPDVRIDALAEGVKVGSSTEGCDMEPRWLPARLLALVDVSPSFSALLSLVGDHASWEVGWSLPPLPQSGMDVFQRQDGNDTKPPLEARGSVTLMAKLATRIAFLGVSADLKDVLHIDISQPQKRGNIVVVMGSPFGVLSPSHFFNSISVGSVQNCCPPGSHNSSLLMADIRCLPGMEGGPVFDSQAGLTGILTRPLRQKGSSAEIQLAITWDAIIAAWSNELKGGAQRSQGELVQRNPNSLIRSINYLPKSSDRPSPSYSSLEKAISSIVLVTVGDGVWASGIVLNSHGLVLTNAHLLEPWRFGRTSLLGQKEKTTSISYRGEGNSDKREEEALLDDEQESSSLELSYRNYKKISVRMDHVKPKIWCDARVVYVSKGPLDVALLQLESVPNQLCPISPEVSCPSKGSTVHVIGHGLVGPRSDLCPSVSSGVLSNVVTMPGPPRINQSSIVDKENLPIMLQTTAAVHPGASGGAVVNSDGSMIGLITSNVRHGGGTIIPHMNFSIPSPALEPIFKFSEKPDFSILKVLDKSNELLSSVWALVSPSPPKLPDAVEKNNDGRGSRFSKFLSEKHVDLIRAKLPSKM